MYLFLTLRFSVRRGSGMCLPCRRRRITIRKTHLTSSAISLSHAACDLLPSDDAISTTPSNVVAESARSLFTVTPHPIGRLQLSALCKACIASSSYSPCQILPSSLKMQKKNISWQFDAKSMRYCHSTHTRPIHL